MSAIINIAEEIVEWALQKLIKDKSIKGYIRSKKNDILDINGIDFLIILLNGYCIPIQIKTYTKKIEEKVKRHHDIHPEIQFVLRVSTHRFRRQSNNIYKAVEQDIRSIIASVNFIHIERL